MAEILGKDLDKYDDSDIANAPFNLVESEIAGPRFMTGQDLSRSAKISAEWKMPIAIPSQAKSDRTVVEEISSSFLTGASDAVANMSDNARNTLAQTYLALAQTYLESGILGNVKRLADMGAGSSGRTIGEGLSRLLGYDMPDDKNKDKLETYDKVVDILEGRIYPLDKYARRVIANATENVESRKIVRELYNQAQGIDSSKLYNQGATILGAMTPTLVLTKGAYGAGRAFGAGRIAATNLATNVAKGYIGAEMAGQYAEETAAQYRERTGDTNFENFTAKDAKGLSAIAYGAIGSQIEFMGGVEPIMAGALNKVGLRSSLLSAGLKIGAGEATEEFLQGITETLMRKIDNTSDKTWAEGFKEALQGAVWGAVIGGGLGTTTFYTNRRNLVKGIKTAFPNISQKDAELVADAGIDSTAEMTTQNPTLRSKLREKVAMMYRDSDIDNKEQNIDAITDLEYSLITMDAAERGIELSEHELFGGVVNELGWFRKGIPENRIAEVQELNNEIKSLKDELAKENAQEEKNWDKIDELETKLAQSNQYILDKISDLARDDARAIRRMLRKTEGKYVKKEKEKATKKAIKGGNVDIIAEILSKAGFKTRDMSGTTIKELARLNWELLQDKDLGQAQSRGTVQRKLADIEANVENGNAVLLRAGYTQEMIDKMDDETWNRAILIQYRKEMPATDEDLVPDEALEELPDNFFQISATQLISPLKRKDYDFTGKRIWLKDNEGKTHIIEPYFILWDGERVPIISLRDSLFVANTQMYKLFQDKGGKSAMYFKDIFDTLLRNIDKEFRGKNFGEMPNGSYEKLVNVDNNKLLLKALKETKKDLTEADSAEVKAQIGVVDTLIENFNDNTIQANFDELVSLSDGTHLITHGISAGPQSVKKFLQNGKVYNPSLYIAEKPSEYGYHSVVLFARPDILKRKDAKIFDRDAYSTTISREPTKKITDMPDEEKTREAMALYDKYFNLESDTYLIATGSQFGDFAKAFEEGVEKLKQDISKYNLYTDVVKKYIIIDALQKGLVDVDINELTRENNNSNSIDPNKLADIFGTTKYIPKEDIYSEVADKALDLIAKKENKTRDEVLDSYKTLGSTTREVIESTGEEATPENIAKAQRQSEKQFGRWRDIINNRNYGFTNTNEELLEARADSGILASIFTREIPFEQMVKEKGKTGRYNSELESRKRIRKYAIMSAMGNLIAHGKISAVFLPPKVKKTDVDAYMRVMRDNPDNMISRAYADETVAEIEKMAKRFAKIYKSLTKEEQDIFVSGIAQIEKHPELESKIKIKLEESGVKNDRVIDDALLLMEEVYNHPVAYFEGKVLSDVDVSDFIGAYVNSNSSWDDVASMLENQGVRVVRGEPSDVKSATIKLEEEIGEDIRFQNRVSGGAPKDYRGAYIPAYRFIQRSNRMDASTLSHELAHDWMEVNFDRFRSGEATPDFMRSWGALEKALGIEENATQVPRKASETFARAYEAWITSNEDWSKFIAVEDKDKDKVEKLLQDYQGELRNIYNDINNKYFKETWGKLGELKPELKAWFDRVVNITDLDVLVERGELTPAQAENEKLNRAIDTVIESTTDEDATKELRKARLLNDTNRYEVEGGNQNSLQNRLSALAREIDDNNMTLKGERYNTRRDMMQVAEAADNFVKTRLDDALAIINGEMAEVEGLYKEDIYTALERLAVETGDMNLISELKNSEIANQLAKELGQRVAGFRNWKQSTEIDVFSALKSLDNNFNKALKNKKAQKQFDSALDLLDESLQNQDKVADKQLDSMLKEWECQ